MEKVRRRNVEDFFTTDFTEYTDERPKKSVSSVKSVVTLFLPRWAYGGQTAVCIALGWFLVTYTTLPAADTASLNGFDSLAIQGDVKAGLAVLERIPAGSLNAEEQKRLECILSRFRDANLPQIQVDGLLTRDVADIYLKTRRRGYLLEILAAMPVARGAINDGQC